MALMLDCKVVPRSGRQLCVLDKSGTLKCFLKSAPEAGKANAELRKILSKALKIPQEDIVIVLGATSRNKRLRINAKLTLDDLYEALGIEQQTSLIE